MKKFLLATSALILIAAAQPAYAADQSALPHLPSKTAIVPPAAIYNWNGCYIGAHGGGGAVSDTFVAGGGLNSENFLHGGSGFAGGQLGCNVQNGVMVLGLEAEAWSGLTNAANFSSSMFTRNRWSARRRGAYRPRFRPRARLRQGRYRGRPLRLLRLQH